jgi:TrmH family RNA methyltransferase
MTDVSHSPAGPISSLANPRVKAAVRLRDRAERDETGLTLVDGGREVLRAIAAGVMVREAFICDELIRSEAATAAVAGLRERGATIIEVTAAVFAKVAYGDRAEGVVAVVETPSTQIDALQPSPDPLILVAEAVEKPGNLGALLRSADGAGADAVVAASPRTDLYNPNAIRASLGTIFAVPLAAAPTADVLAWLRRQGIRIVAARPGADQPVTAADLTGPLAIAVGAEAAGLSDAWTAADIQAVGLPMLGMADSLNVAAASAVLLYEARRQRGLPAGSSLAR